MEITLSHGMTQLVQLAIAPVFMLTSVAAFLAVLTNRLGRVIDRSRYLENLSIHCEEDSYKRSLELNTLFRRVRLINWAISLLTACALLTCFMIAILFVGNFIALNLSVFIAGIFILAMGCLIGGLSLLQREIYLAIRTMRLLSE